MTSLKYWLYNIDIENLKIFLVILTAVIITVGILAIATYIANKICEIIIEDDEQDE